MHIKNSLNRFGVVAITFHWLMAFLIIGMLCIGLYMVSLPVGLEKLKLYGQHKEFGLLVLFLAVFRLLWRVTNPVPKLDLPRPERAAARGMHWVLYLLMFAMPISGWLMTSAAGFLPSFFGLITLPGLIAVNDSARILFAAIHGWLAYTLIAAIFLHTAAALKHHFINRDNVLKRMFSWR